jgi:hypothetical protein
MGCGKISMSTGVGAEMYHAGFMAGAAISQVRSKTLIWRGHFRAFQSIFGPFRTILIDFVNFWDSFFPFLAFFDFGNT